MFFGRINTFAIFVYANEKLHNRKTGQTADRNLLEIN